MTKGTDQTALVERWKNTLPQPFALTTGIMREYFRWLKGEEKLSSIKSSPGKLRHFCSVGGSHLVAGRLNQPHVIIRVATLDENPHATLQTHIWTSHDNPWPNYENIPGLSKMAAGAIMDAYLDSSEYIDWKHPLVTAQAAALSAGCLTDHSTTI